MIFYFRFKNTFFIWFIISLLLVSCGSKKNNQEIKDKKQNLEVKKPKKIIVGADNFELYIPLLKEKNIAVVANQTSMMSKNIHLVDYLNTKFPNKLQCVFAPEHGFRGKADAGEHIKHGVDTKTQLPIISLYGKNKKPSKKQLQNIDIILFDIQDVGIRFYTYISTLHYVMEACAEQNIKLIVLDRPNPNAHYIDGPMLEKKHTSFVGMHPIPLVYGMTIGEYAQMINGEKWLKNGVQCDLKIIPLQNYTHQTTYNLPIKPSPNLPNSKSVNLYPSLGFFEGTNVSCGRGTEMQFQIFGSPFLDKKSNPFKFTPKPNFGAKYPKHDGKLCYGQDLRNYKKLNLLNLEWLIEAYINTKDKTSFFIPYFTTLAGTTKLQKQIEQGYTYREIRKTWLKDLTTFKKVRNKYLIYN